jgi:phytoene dehydrogenase-like protein
MPEFPSVSSPSEKKKYETVVVGLGMSGLAAGIRLAMFNRRVLILEKHSIAGGLNSFYQRGKRKFDVGLHALTNFALPKEKRAPLSTVLRQLRIPFQDLQLCQQNYSLIQFPKHQLKFSNDLSLIRNSVREQFPAESENFERLIRVVQDFTDENLYGEFSSARKWLESIIGSIPLCEMLLAPLLIYGSSWERDMDVGQFVIMFRAIYLEGFSRPEGGVRTIIDRLLERFKKAASEGGVGELKYKAEVVAMDYLEEEREWEIHLKSGETIRTEKILSTIGHYETERLLGKNSRGAPLSFADKDKPVVGKMSFAETILVFKGEISRREGGAENDQTIIFHCADDRYDYENPKELVDARSAVICFPGNFQGGAGRNWDQVQNQDQIQDQILDRNQNQTETVIRVTYLANYDLWAALSPQEYKAEKQRVFQLALDLVMQAVGNETNLELVFKDVFTPLTIERYTGHYKGTVYGGERKLKTGATSLPNLFLAGTDQGFLGIVGSLLSGIAMANAHCLNPTEPKVDHVI